MLRPLRAFDESRRESRTGQEVEMNVASQHVLDVEALGFFASGQRVTDPVRLIHRPGLCNLRTMEAVAARAAPLTKEMASNSTRTARASLNQVRVIEGREIAARTSSGS